MSDTSPVSTPISAGVLIMPTNFDIMRNAIPAEPAAAASAPPVAENTVATDVMTVSVSFLTDSEQLEAMLPPGKHLSIHGPPVVTVSAGRSPFRLQDLVELARLLQSLCAPVTEAQAREVGHA